MILRAKVARLLNDIMVFVLMGVLLAAYDQQFFGHERPCPLCMLQRLGMVGVALGALMNLRFGLKPMHYAFSLLSALLGQVVATRQILLHICPNFPQYGVPVFGLSLYTWSYITQVCAIFAISGMLFLDSAHDRVHKHLRWWESMAFLLVFLLISGNIVTTFLECGFGDCPDTPRTEKVMENY
jgi:disulfide bond formation protein DsbB